MFQQGSLRLFRLLGVTVWLSWTWLLIVPLEMWRLQINAWHPGDLGALARDIAEYMCVFVIVLIHEFGHALACKSVGGRADRIVLRLLGGVAYVQPPQRPGPWLWCIAAGPLVNVVLVPVLLIPAIMLGHLAVRGGALHSDFFGDLALMNIALLVFNILPIYPLDGGQILMALLWFVVGRGTSLIIVAVIGIMGALGLLGLAALTGSMWWGLMAVFIGVQAVRGIQVGMRFQAVENAMRHGEAACPACGQHPPAGNYWGCPCGAQFDTFAGMGQCPRCGRGFAATSCPYCHQLSPIQHWYGTAAFPVLTPPGDGQAPPVQ